MFLIFLIALVISIIFHYRWGIYSYKNELRGSEIAVKQRATKISLLLGLIPIISVVTLLSLLLAGSYHTQPSIRYELWRFWGFIWIFLMIFTIIGGVASITSFPVGLNRKYYPMFFKSRVAIVWSFGLNFIMLFSAIPTA